jgi:hypothetical protein
MLSVARWQVLLVVVVLVVRLLLWQEQCYMDPVAAARRT